MNQHNIARLVSPFRKLLVAFSCGLDSTVLLHKLMLWRKYEHDVQLRVIHINHGLNTKAEEWVEHCKNICSIWNIPFIIKRVKICNEGLGNQAQARKARYAAFANALQPGEGLVTAHHLDDQCETFMLALKRGSGPTGLSAMQISSNFAGTQLLRPMLGETRKSIASWALKHNLLWIEDDSNQDDCYDRNYFRLHILPLLSQRWAHFPAAIARSAALCAEHNSLLNELLDIELHKITSNQGTISIAALKTISKLRRYGILRRWLSANYALMPNRGILTRIWNDVALAREDAVPCLRIKQYEVRRFKGYLWFITYKKSLSDKIFYWENTQKPLMLPNNAGSVLLKNTGKIRFPEPNEIVTIRFKARGMLYIIGRNRGRKLKKIWQELNIPPWKRNTTPLLFYNEQLIAAANGIFITHKGAVQNNIGVNFEWTQ